MYGDIAYCLRQSFLAGLFSLAGAASAFAQTNTAPSSSSQDQQLPGFRNLQMRFVSPEEADRFFAARMAQPNVVPQEASAPNAARAAARQAPQAVNAPAFVRQSAPPGAPTPQGFSRADFAAAKQGGAPGSSVGAGRGGVLAPPSRATAVSPPPLPAIAGPDGKPIVVPPNAQ